MGLLGYLPAKSLVHIQAGQCNIGLLGRVGYSIGFGPCAEGWSHSPSKISLPTSLPFSSSTPPIHLCSTPTPCASLTQVQIYHPGKCRGRIWSPQAGTYPHDSPALQHICNTCAVLQSTLDWALNI